MIANYHTHTSRCHHAVGEEIAYVENAIARGLEICGFSDHTPQWFPGRYYSTMRMLPKQLSEYCETVRGLQQQFQGQIQVPLGLEVEYYPDLFPVLLDKLREAGIEYMLLGQHWIGNEYDAPYVGKASDQESILAQYCDQVMEAMDTGLFTYLAHPDLIHYKGDPKIYRYHMTRLCQAAKQTGTPLEINFLGLSNDRHYPNDAFWELVGQEGCPVVFGVDAHHPDEILDTMTLRRAQRMVNQFSLELLDTVPLKRIT